MFEIVVDLIERDFVRLFEFRNTPSSESIRLVKGEEVKVVLGLMSNWEYQLSTYYDLIGTDKGAGTLDALSDNEWKPSGDFIKSNGVAQWRLEEDY
ncbi:MAG: hypothetical protein EP346_12510 [Bacteroidetes bacterium]|nr:MAG: hypothetical protein EP346_12510 [Bacteroidota bacterium]